MEIKKAKGIRNRSVRKRKLSAAQAEDNQQPKKSFDLSEDLQHNSMLHIVFDAITDLVSIQDLNFNLVAVNKAYANAVKMNPREIVGKKCYEIIHGTSYPVRDCPHAESLRTKKAITKDIFDPHLGKYFQVTISPLFDDSGEITGTVQLMKDITEKKQAEESLQKSNQRYRNLVESTSDFIWEVNQEGIYTYASPKIYDILGYKPEELIGKTPFFLMPPEEADSILNIFLQSVSEESPVKNLENINLHKDGHPVVLETSGVPLYDADGTFQGYRGIDRDITQRKKMEEALKMSEERLRQYFNLGLVGMAIESPTGEWEEVNDRLCEIYGYPREELMQLHWKSLTHPDDLDKDITQFGQILRGEINFYSLEKRYIRKDGEIIHAMISVSCTRSHSGEVNSIFVLVVDITERKKAEAALVKAKEELENKVIERTAELASANKQLEVYTREIIRAQETERKRVAVELHDDTAQSLALLALEIDKILNGREKLPEDTLMRLKILRDDVNRTQKEVRRFSHELRPGVLDYLGLEPALEGLVNDINDRGEIAVDLEIMGKERRLSDEVELSLFRIAQESLNNSLKHSHATKASINLKFYSKKVTLRISDNGQGFNVKKDGQDAIKRRRLGLVGMRERAELIGGKLKIISIVGKGSTVSIEVMQ